jgi:hypothetical protein
MTQKIYHSGLDKMIEVYTVRSPANGKQIRYDNEDVEDGKRYYASIIAEYPNFSQFDLADAFSQEYARSVDASCWSGSGGRVSSGEGLSIFLRLLNQNFSS